MENNELITVAIHSKAKAESLREFLVGKGVAVSMEELENTGNSDSPQRFLIKVPLSQLEKALSVMGVSDEINHPTTSNFPDDGKKRILVGVDYSADSVKACQIAFHIAKEINAKVKILHVYNNVTLPLHFPFADLVKDSDRGGINLIRKKMLQFCIDIDEKIANGEWASVNYSYSLREGLVVEEIMDFIQEYKPTMVVLGTQGEHRTENNLVGSVTADILEITNVPILAVPKTSVIENLDDIKHVAYLISLKDWDFNSFDTLATFVSFCKNVRITLLHLNLKQVETDSIKQDMDKIHTLLKDRYPKYNIDMAILNIDDIARAEDVFKKQNVTMICVNTRKRNLFGRIFSPSFTRKVLINTNKALLVLRG